VEPDLRQPRGPSPFRSLGFASVVLVALTVGCGHKVGDSCTNSADCDPSGGTRTCDLSQPGGYCIVEGCDARSCPSDSVCVRFFPCDPAAACTTAVPGSCCDPGEVCVADELGIGACARTTLEKRACVQTCGGNGDCRGGYLCRIVGTCGTLALTLTPDVPAKFCAPIPPTASGGPDASCSL
jgi:hypothetical protein